MTKNLFVYLISFSVPRILKGVFRDLSDPNHIPIILQTKLQNKEIRSDLKYLTNDPEFLVVTNTTISQSRASKTPVLTKHP